MADTPKKVKERKLTDYKYPIPDPDPYTSGPFWEGAKEGKLMLPRCEDCNRAHWYPRIICPFCYSRSISWFEESGEGTLYTFAVQQRAFAPGWSEEGPYVTCYIDLNEGDRMFGVLLGGADIEPWDLFKKIGSKCKIEFVKANDDVHVPFWRLAE